MKRVSSSPISAALAPDADRAEPLHLQLYLRMREQILSGYFAAGLRMPSTRSLAADLKISRNTILGAFEQLRAEGYLEAATGSGTYVARSIPDQAISSARLMPIGAAGKPSRQRLSKLGARALRGEGTIVRAPSFRPFQPGFPALDVFPTGIWAKLSARHHKTAGAGLLGYGQAAGYLPLRKAIAQYLTVARGVSCEAAQVIVVAGAQQAFGLVARTVLDPGDSVLMEEPGYIGARVAFEAAALKLIPAPVDAEGINFAALRARTAGARLVYTTPAHQYPLGVTMSIARRMQLVNWAADTGAWILEDDYDGEFRYSSRPLPALQSFDRCGSVIYVGTFSKLLFPALRLGYIVAPKQVADAFVISKTVNDYHCPTIDQAVVADFIDEGHFGRHVRRMRMLYLERMEALMEAAQAELPEGVEIGRPNAGMHAVIRFAPCVDDLAVAEAAGRAGITVGALSPAYAGPRAASGLVLGFAGYRPGQIRAAMRKLAGVIAAEMRSGASMQRRSAI